MADLQNEINPAKKIKLCHDIGENGDHLQNDKDEKKEAENTEMAVPDDDKDGSKDSEVITEDDLNREGNLSADMSDAESDVSALSSMSGLSGEDSWKAAPSGPMSWIYKCMEDGVDPRSILRQILTDDTDIPDLDNFSLWKLVVNLVSEPPPRDKLPEINTLDDVLELLRSCDKIMVLTGAGVSVSCGIPDFRSRNGIYARLAEDFPDLPDPQAMFDIRYFRKDQRPFFKFAKEIYPGQFEPSRCHKFIRLIEQHGKLLRNYTQNIDTLEQVAGIQNVIQCHGSFATATCMACQHKCSSDDIKEQIMSQVIPLCPKCDPATPLSVMKPDIVFFGESLPEEFHHQMSVDKDECDLLIVIGSSLKVRPVALIPNSLPAHVPQILINKEHLRNMNFDVELLGDCDVVIGEICRRLGDDWGKIASTEPMTEICMDELLTPASSPKPDSDNKSNSEIDKKASEKCNQSNSTEIGPSEVKLSSNTESDVCNEGPPDGSKMESNNLLLAGSIVKSVNSVSENSQRDSANTEASPNVDTSKPNSANNTKTAENLPELSSSKQLVPSLDNSSGPDSGKIPGQSSGNTLGQSSEKPPGPCSGDTSGPSSEKPAGPSSSNDLNPGTTADVKKLRKMWKPQRHSVAARLGANKYCFIPPCKYIFPDAEYFVTVQSDSESDDFSDSYDNDDKDISMDSDKELDCTTTTGSSVKDAIDLVSDEENVKNESPCNKQKDTDILDNNVNESEPVSNTVQV